MRAADAAAPRPDAATGALARASQDGQVKLAADGAQTDAFLQAISELAAHTANIDQQRLGAAADGPLEAAQASTVIGDGQTPTEGSPRGPASDGSEPLAIVPQGSLAEVAAALGVGLARISGCPTNDPQPSLPGAVAEGANEGAGGVRPQGSDARQRLAIELAAANAKVAIEAASSAFSVVGRETHLAPVVALATALPQKPGTASVLPALADAGSTGASAVAQEQTPLAGRAGNARNGGPAQPTGSLPAIGDGDATAPGVASQRAEGPTQPLAGLAADAGGESQAHPAFSPTPRPGGKLELHTQAEAMTVALPTSTLRQVAERIATEVLAGADSGSGSLAAARKAPSPSALKVLSIELQPVELGTVRVRMSLRDDAMVVEITADRQETARLLQQDREALSRLLQGSGVGADGLLVLSRPRDNVGPPTGLPLPQFTAPQQGDQGFAHPDARSFAKQGQGGREQRNLQASQKTDDEISSARPGGSLYV